ncbi:MAG: hypothetical protein ACK4QL_05625 [Pseudanabaenaceae cyanobacterium]
MAVATGLGRSGVVERLRTTINFMAGIGVVGIVLASVMGSTNLLGGLAVGIVVLAGGFLWTQAQLRPLTKPLANLHQLAQTYAHKYLPDLNFTGDELTNLQNIVQQMGERLTELSEQLAAEGSADIQLQNRLRELSQIVANLAQGNLDIQTKEGEEVNRYIQALVDTVRAIYSQTEQVKNELTELQTVTTDLRDRAQAQQSYLQKTQADLAKMGKLVKLAQEQEQAVTEATQMAELAVQEAGQGIVSLTESINSLQTGTGLIVQRIRNLDEFVTLAKEFVLEQKRLASLTQVLAMNASMVAARAVEQREPDQFASVAREFAAIASQVNSLATQTNQGLVVLQQRTGFVEVVVSGIDKDIKDVTNLVSQFTDSVNRSQQSFDYLKQVSAQMAQVAEQVLTTNQALGNTVQSVLGATEQVFARSEELLRQINAVQSQGQALSQQIAQLAQQIAKFRLPA